jgi:dihydroorotase
VRASGEATPHHLVLTDEAVRSLDSNFKMNPPLRSADDRKALVDAVRDGTITVIATDHAPHALNEKDVPFEEAPFGVTGPEAFASLNTHLVGPGLLTLGTLIERMSARARLRLEAPAVRVGERGELVLPDPEAVWRVGDGGFRSRSGNRSSARRSRARCG